MPLFFLHHLTDLAWQIFLGFPLRYVVVELPIPKRKFLDRGLENVTSITLMKKLFLETKRSHLSMDIEKEGRAVGMTTRALLLKNCSYLARQRTLPSPSYALLHLVLACTTKKITHNCGNKRC